MFNFFSGFFFLSYLLFFFFDFGCCLFLETLRQAKRRAKIGNGMSESQCQSMNFNEKMKNRGENVGKRTEISRIEII